MRVQDLSESEIQIIIDSTAIVMQLTDLKRIKGSRNIKTIKSVFNKLTHSGEISNIFSRKEIGAISEATSVAITMIKNGMVNEQYDDMPLLCLLNDKFQKASKIKITAPLIKIF